MKTFGDKLRELRKSKHLSLDELTAQLRRRYKTSISKSMLSRYENGKSKDVPLENVRILTDFFHVSPDYFINDYASDRNSGLHEVGAIYSVSSSVSLPIVNLPIVGRISCGNGIFAYEDIEGYEPTPKNWLNGGKYFYLRAKGDSMSGARINDGDLLFIREQEDIEDGEIAAVYINGEARLKRVYKRDGALVLQSENPKYPPVVLKSGDVRIIGKLKKVVIEY